jgi:hypothetical protein
MTKTDTWEDVNYYFLPHGMKRVLGFGKKGLVFKGTSFDMRKFLIQELASQRQELIQEVEGMVKVRNPRLDYIDHDFDMTIKGYNQALDDVLKKLEEK